MFDMVRDVPEHFPMVTDSDKDAHDAVVPMSDRYSLPNEELLNLLGISGWR